MNDMKLIDIGEDGKAAALWIAESAIRIIAEKEEYYHFCRETIDLCWEWFVNRKVDQWDIYDRVTCDEINLLDKKDSELSDKYDMILVSVTYLMIGYLIVRLKSSKILHISLDMTRKGLMKQ